MEDLATSLKKIVQAKYQQDIEPEFSRPNEQFGDYSTNIALQLAGKLGRPPREIATELAGALQTELDGRVSEVTVAGPGFVNVTLNDDTLALLAANWHERPKTRTGKTVVIETNNPNPFKDLHIGHAYNSIVADTIANLLEASGAQTHRVSYHGDVGLHVGKSMWWILQMVAAKGELQTPPTLQDKAAFMSLAYQGGAYAYENDPEAHRKIDELSRESFALEDPKFKEIYETCKAWSFEYLQDTIARLGSKPVEKRYMEREADKLGREAVESHMGDVFVESEGAVILPEEKSGLHTRVFINSRGATLYEARDLGLIQLKHRDFHPDASYIATAEEQRDYFNVVFKAAELVLPELAGKTINISHGTVKLSTGKMSSRTGQVINIDWLFEELEKAIRARGGTDETLQDTIVGALRYTMLKVSVGGDIIFDINDSISLEGNSGPYLQYAHARARSILGKADVPENQQIETLEPDERSLVRKMSEYKEVVERAADKLSPHIITTYLYELSQEFNRFYEHNRVIDDPRQNLRLQLVGQYADILQDGLELLNIPAPERL